MSANADFVPTDPATAAIDAVGRTCLLTTALRAMESNRPDRLYADPYAAALAGEVGFTLLAEVARIAAEATAEAARTGGPKLPATADFNAIRTRFLDDRLTAAVAAGVRQVVVLGSGMDMRPYRLHWAGPVTFFELDRPPVVAAKAAAVAALPGALPAVDVRRVPADLLGTAWPEALRSAGYDPAQPSCWVLEGLLYYLAEPQVHGLLDQVRRLSAPGSSVGGDLVTRTGLDAPHLKPMLDMYAAWGTPWVFGSDEPEELFRAHGVNATVLQPGEPGADHGRWRDPVPPRDVPGVERMFLAWGERV